MQTRRSRFLGIIFLGSSHEKYITYIAMGRSPLLDNVLLVVLLMDIQVYNDICNTSLLS